jgi:uncharacterized protein
MNSEEHRLITELFQRLRAAETRPRDPEVERLIADELRRAPNAPYAMAQTIIAQSRAAEAAAQSVEQSGDSVMGAPALTRRGSVPSYGRGAAEGRGGFLANAGQVALGVAGGMLLADAAKSVLGGSADTDAGAGAEAANSELATEAGLGDIVAAEGTGEPSGGAGFFDWLFGGAERPADGSVDAEHEMAGSDWDDGGGGDWS